MSEPSADSKHKDTGSTNVWGRGMRKRLSIKAGIDPRLIDRLNEPIRLPSKTGIKEKINQIDRMIEKMESELYLRKSTERSAIAKLKKNQSCFLISNQPSNISSAEQSEEYLFVTVWDENRQRHALSERKLLYPGCDSISHEIDPAHIIHRNIVTNNRNRNGFIPVIAAQARERYQHYMIISKKYKKLQDRWNLTHHEEEDVTVGIASRNWKDDTDSKREKRQLPNRTMSRITRSQTSNMVECESVTSRDPDYFTTRQADVSNRRQDPCRYKYVTHNSKLTTDGKPMICQDLPRNLSCPRHCNCPYQVNEINKHVRPWSDMEKFIFLNGFFNRPKDFRYIASTLTNRSVQDVIDFYYLHKRGMYTKLLLRVQLSMWKNMNYDARPLILVAAYGIGLPIPEEVFNPNYGDYDMSDYIFDDHVSLLNSKQGLKPDDEMLLHDPAYHYRVEDNEHITPALLQERHAERERRIEQLLMDMGVDLKHCIPSEEKDIMKSEHGVMGGMEKEKLMKQLVESSEEEGQIKRQRLDLLGKRKMHRKDDEDYS